MGCRWDTEKIEHLQLELGELGLEELHELAVAYEVVTLDFVEDLEDARGGGSWAAAQLGVERDPPEPPGAHGFADLALDEGFYQLGEEVAREERLDALR